MQLHSADIDDVGGSIEQADEWYRHFAVYTPRALGTVAVLVSAAALGKAATKGVALALTMLVGVLVVAGERRWRARKANPATTDSLQGVRRTRNITFAVAVLSFLTMFAVSRFETDLGLRRLTVASGGCLAAAWGFYLWVQYRRILVYGAQTKTASEDDALSASAKLARIKWQVGAAAVVSLIMFVLFTYASVPVGRRLGPLWVLAIFAANSVFVGSLLVRYGTWYSFPLVRVMLALAVIFSIWNDNHLTRTIPQQSAVDKRLHLDSQYRSWRGVPGAPGRDKVFLVAASGGGLRAAYWTAVALANIQDAHPGFANRIFAYSTVSGGSLGGALFAALAHDGDSALTKMSCASDTLKLAVTRYDSTAGPYARCVRRFLRDDFLSPVLAKMVAPDLLQRFIPVTFKVFDRSTALEETWEASYRKATDTNTFQRGVAAIGADSVSQLRGTLFLNSTHVETGRRFIASSVRFDNTIGDA
jgi:hypothetical protein